MGAKVSTNLSDYKRNKQISRYSKTQIIDYKEITKFRLSKNQNFINPFFGENGL